MSVVELQLINFGIILLLILRNVAVIIFTSEIYHITHTLIHTLVARLSFFSHLLIPLRAHRRGPFSLLAFPLFCFMHLNAPPPETTHPLI